jgi:ubiquinone/menaquinone biosynthesis C-methylase UbiE
MSSENNAALSKPYYSFNYASAILQQFSIYYCKAKSFIYDAIILRMTEKWYRAVLERVEDGSMVLDVGVGTGGTSYKASRGTIHVTGHTLFCPLFDSLLNRC